MSQITIQPAVSIKIIGQQIAEAFLAKLKGLKLSADEALIVNTAGQALAASAILIPGASDEVKLLLQSKTNLALAALENISVAKAIQAEQLMRQTAMDVMTTALKIAISVAIAA